MKWKYVFNSDISVKGIGRTIVWMAEFVKPTGYKFFTWNGFVHSVETGQSTGIPVSDLF